MMGCETRCHFTYAWCPYFGDDSLVRWLGRSASAKIEACRSECICNSLKLHEGKPSHAAEQEVTQTCSRIEVGGALSGV